MNLYPYSTKPSISPTSPDYSTYCNYHRFRLAAVINDEGIRAVPISYMTDMLFFSETSSASSSFSLYTYRNGDDITLKSGISLPYPTYHDLISSSSSSTTTEISEPPSDTEKPKSEGYTSFLDIQMEDAP